jgi:aspartyl-tRNA(Asn)/glutamyl-tRNA(Gln) amidotransferase subunit C
MVREMLTDKEVRHIANLARIELSDAERERFQHDLSSVLEYINKLNEVSVDGVQPLYQAMGLAQALRPDEHRGDFPMTERLNELLIGQAPHRQERFVKVQSVKSKKSAVK